MLIDSCCPWQKLKGLDADAKFEFAKRKLQESYQQHDKGSFLLLFKYIIENKKLINEIKNICDVANSQEAENNTSTRDDPKAR